MCCLGSKRQLVPASAYLCVSVSVVLTLLPQTESLAAAAKGELLIPAVSIPRTGLSTHDDTGGNWAQYSLYKYIACTLQTT